MNTTSLPPATEEETKRRRGVLKAITEHWLPFLTAVLVLATAAVGLYAKQATDERTDLETERDQLADNSASLEAEMAELSDRNEDLQAANEGLEADNDALRGQGESSDESGPPTTSGSGPSETPEVFRDTSGTPVVVPEYSGIDLDSQDSNWGIESSSRDLYVSGGARTVNVSDTLAIVEAPPTIDDCEAQTVREDGLDAPHTVVGQQMCVRSREGRWAYVRIAGIDTEAKTMSFEITVWKLPSDP